MSEYPIIQPCQPLSERGHLNSYLFLIELKLKGGIWLDDSSRSRRWWRWGILVNYHQHTPSIFFRRKCLGEGKAKGVRPAGVWSKMEQSGGQSRGESADVLSLFSLFCAVEGLLAGRFVWIKIIRYGFKRVVPVVKKKKRVILLFSFYFYNKQILIRSTKCIKSVTLAVRRWSVAVSHKGSKCCVFKVTI